MLVFEFGQGQRVAAADMGWFLSTDGDEGFRQSLVLMLARDLPRLISGRLRVGDAC